MTYTSNEEILCWDWRFAIVGGSMHIIETFRTDAWYQQIYCGIYTSAHLTEKRDWKLNTSPFSKPLIDCTVCVLAGMLLSRRELTR